MPTQKADDEKKKLDRLAAAKADDEKNECDGSAAKETEDGRPKPSHAHPPPRLPGDGGDGLLIVKNEVVTSSGKPLYVPPLVVGGRYVNRDGKAIQRFADGSTEFAERYDKNEKSGMVDAYFWSTGRWKTDAPNLELCQITSASAGLPPDLD